MSRSFAESIKDKCYGGSFEEVEQYVENSWRLLNLYQGCPQDRGG
jgi:hypothetical protein